MDKRGEDVSYGELIFTLVNVLFFGVLMIFLWNSYNSAFVLEENYAKQIALTLDSAKPGMDFKINVTEMIEIARENGVDEGEIFFISEGIVKVSLNKKGGYATETFSDYLIESGIQDGELHLKVR